MKLQYQYQVKDVSTMTAHDMMSQILVTAKLRHDLSDTSLREIAELVLNRALKATERVRLIDNLGEFALYIVNSDRLIESVVVIKLTDYIGLTGRKIKNLFTV